MFICNSVCISYNLMYMSTIMLCTDLGTIAISELIDKNNNTTQMRSDYGAMHTLLDTIKASPHACFVFNSLTFSAQWLSLVQQFWLYILAKLYNKLFKS